MQKQIYDYHVYDSRRIKEIIQKKMISVTITSPPYWKLKNYNSELQIGYGQKYKEYLDTLVNVFKDIYDLTKDNGSLWIVIDTFRHNKEIKLLPFDLAVQLKKIGWRLQDIIIWAKNKNLPWSHKGKLRNIFEYILFFSKGDEFKFYVDRIKEPRELKKWWIRYPERYNPKGKVPERIWDFPIPTQGSWSNGWIRHFCPFPPPLVERIILLTTNKNDIVLDPFAGSGVVLAQSIVMGRRAIGFDINASYKDMYQMRVLPYIKAEWIKRKKELVRKQKERNNFSSMIRVLRQLKYPKMLIKHLNKKGILNLASINYIFLIGDKKGMSPTIFFVLEDKFYYSFKLNEEFKLVMSQPPLSKFGLDPIIKVIYKDEYKEFYRDFKQKFVFIYEDGNTHYYKLRMHFSKWSSEYANTTQSKLKKMKFPPIISNMGIRICN